MRWLYTGIIFIHVLSVIASIGPYFVFFPLLKTLRTADGKMLQQSLAIFRFVVWLTKHAGHILVVSGAILWIWGGYPLLTTWIAVPVTILLGGLFFLVRAFSPTLRALEQGTIGREAAIKRLTRSTLIYLLVLTISLWFMIAKPVWW
ncbi:MAG: hypothetical protein BSOLF_0309 [Candidatus Carbobacillus altaicus]|uniref:DUF2269 family protein n=1 Tax=Candidatus Carbonibacillus altaicus TaxID=2163959 RepID=A0A2R6Y120_9BACL|nr:MAG: hypothetical protein BSOLF_0309 [Candidatus Carbobacillus altaicus]